MKRFEHRRNVLGFVAAACIACLGSAQVADAAAPAFNISGKVSPPELAAGTTVRITGAATASTVVDNAGYYSFGNLPKGNYVVTPSVSGAWFAPQTSSVTIKNADVTSVNFTANAGTLVFFDDFTAPLDMSVWRVKNEPGDASNSEVQCYKPSNVTTSGSVVTFTAKSDRVVCDGTKFAYSSGMIQWDSFNFTYGTVEIRAKMSGGTTWPALWFVGANCQYGSCDWPQPGSDEIDMVEILGSQQTRVNQQIHSGSNNSGCTAWVSDTSQNWHTYKLIWAPGSLTWMIDGGVTCSLTDGVPTTPMFLIMNVALGGAGGPVDKSTLPQAMSVDYVLITQ